MRRLLNLLSLMTIVAMVSVALWFYLSTDKIAIPAHWNAVGDIDSYGKTWTILVLAAVGVGVYLLLLLNQKACNLDLPFTVRDPERARPFVRMLATWATWLTSLLFLYVVGAVAQLYPFRGAVVLLDVLALVAATAYYLSRVRKHGG